MTAVREEDACPYWTTIASWHSHIATLSYATVPNGRAARQYPENPEFVNGVAEVQVV